MIYEKMPVVLLSMLNSEKSSTVNHTIASYIIQNHREVMHMGIADLASACFVGTGSVSRFCRDIGLRDYSELRRILAETDFAYSPISDEPDEASRTGKLTDYLSSSLKRASLSYDPAQLEKLCADLNAYQNIHAFGHLKAECAAISMQADFLMMSKYIHTGIAFSEQIDSIVRSGKEDLIIIYSFTGSYFDGCSLREKEKHLALPKIWMICGTDRKLPWFVNEALRFDSDHERYSHPWQLQLMENIIASEYAYRNAG